MTAAPILDSRVRVTLADGRTHERPACVFGPLAVAMHRDGDVISWIVVHLASGCEIRDAATASGTQAMVLVGALLALPIDWYLISPIASKRDTVSRTLASVKAVLA